LKSNPFCGTFYGEEDDCRPKFPWDGERQKGQQFRRLKNRIDIIADCRYQIEK